MDCRQFGLSWVREADPQRVEQTGFVRNVDFISPEGLFHITTVTATEDYWPAVLGGAAGGFGLTA
jgi:hypothetical protein